MNNPSKPKQRLSRNSWLEVALELLQDEGINAVTVDALALQLGITRGSFYHHFKNRNDLSKEMLEYWKEKWTVEIRDDIASLGLDGLQSLTALMNLIRHRKSADYDSAVRAWATAWLSSKVSMRISGGSATSTVRVDQKPAHHVQAASNCQLAKDELNQAKTQKAVEIAVTKVRTLCED